MPAVIGRILGALYLTAGCVWAWRWTSAFGIGLWRASLRGCHFMPGPIAPVVATVFWLYDGIAEIALWPLGVRREMRFRRWLKANVSPSPPAVAPVSDARGRASSGPS